MYHPQYPYKFEESKAMSAALESMACGQPKDQEEAILKIRTMFTELRNKNFPGWLEKYESEFQEWLKSQRA